MIWLTKSLSITLAALVVWGFLMGFLFNALMWFTKNKKDSLLLFTSFVMFMSYFISDHIYQLDLSNYVYITWFFFDIGTLLIIAYFYVKFKLPVSVGVKYTTLGLCINSILFLSIHIDIVVMETTQRWWLWSAYSAGVNIIDFMMIFALILNRDYLGFIKISKYMTSFIREKALN